VPKCIPIVDDHQNVRKLIRAFLETETGFKSAEGQWMDWTPFKRWHR
jgi:hypothetical protein